MSDGEVNSIIHANTVSQFSTNDDSMNRLRGCLRYFYKITTPNVDTTSTVTTGDAISPVQTSQDHTMSEAQASTSEHNMAKDQPKRKKFYFFWMWL